MPNDVFAIALAYVLLFEGGYVNDPRDPGGETYKGISRRFHPKWRGWERVDMFKELPGRDSILAADRTLTTAVEDFYRVNFWDALRCGEMPPKVAAKVFESAVNLGPTWPIKTLQQILPVYTNKDPGPADGVPGPMTLRALAAANEDVILESLRSNQLVTYEAICRRDPGARVYALGWARRARN